jgi:hypothetical protein
VPWCICKISCFAKERDGGHRRLPAVSRIYKRISHRPLAPAGSGSSRCLGSTALALSLGESSAAADREECAGGPSSSWSLLHLRMLRLDLQLLLVAQKPRRRRAVPSRVATRKSRRRRAALSRGNRAGGGSRHRVEVEAEDGRVAVCGHEEAAAPPCGGDEGRRRDRNSPAVTGRHRRGAPPRWSSPPREGQRR